MAKSAVGPVINAVVAAIEGSSALASLLAGDKVYNTQVPDLSPLDYVTVSNPAESASNMFGARGTAASLQLDIWTKNTARLGNARQVAIYDALYQLLHGQPLAVTGFRMVIGTLTLIAIAPDADGITLHGIARYDVTQREA